jgi:hypothetical protein
METNIDQRYFEAFRDMTKMVNAFGTSTAQAIAAFEAFNRSVKELEEQGKAFIAAQQEKPRQ